MEKKVLKYEKLINISNIFINNIFIIISLNISFIKI